MLQETEQRWLGVLRKWRSGKLGAREFCRLEGVNFRTFTNYRGKLRDRISPVPAATPEFIEISPAMPNMPMAKITIGRLTVTLDNCSASDICVILKTLGADSCCR